MKYMRAAYYLITVSLLFLNVYCVVDSLTSSFNTAVLALNLTAIIVCTCTLIKLK